MQSNSTSSSDQLPRLDNQLCFALYSASLATTKLYQPLLKPWGLTYPQYLVMLALWEKDDCVVSELGERLFLDSGTLTPLLKRMEGAGWLQRRRDSADERRVRVALTEAGRDLRTKVVGISERMLQQSPCTLSELQALRLQLQQWRDHLVTRLPRASN